jgi:inward rectifier potassium channel
MSLRRKNFRDIETTGFGTQSTSTGSRLYSKDGAPNLIKKGVSFFDRLSWFHSMLSMPRWKFWLLIGLSFISINLIFATIYVLIGIEHLSGVTDGSGLAKFAEAFFFSAQTLTTVGYGRISPTGTGTSAVAALEGFVGLMGLALASGLFYGRFSRPRAFLKFSENALISPYKDGAALMFRTVPYKNHHLMDAEVKLTASMRLNEDGVERNKFFGLDVEFSKINALVMNWTIVHPITEESPLYGYSVEELRQFNLEILVFLKAYDEGFSNTVVARTSYTAEEIITGAKFVPMYYSSGDATVLDIAKLNSFEKIKLPEITQALS